MDGGRMGEDAPAGVRLVAKIRLEAAITDGSGLLYSMAVLVRSGTEKWNFIPFS